MFGKSSQEYLKSIPRERQAALVRSHGQDATGSYWSRAQDCPICAEIVMVCGLTKPEVDPEPADSSPNGFGSVR